MQIRIQIRRAVEADANRVWETHVSSIRELCFPYYSSAQIDAWAGRLRSGAHLDSIQAGKIFVADQGGRIVGFGESEAERQEVRAIYVHPRSTRQGIGTFLFGRLKEELRGHGLSRAWLDASLPSVPFYSAMGCRRVEDRVHRLGSGVELACVRMVVDL